MGKAGITRSLPNDQYQAAINADNPSASNPFLTASALDGAFGYGYFYRTTDGVAALPNTDTAIAFDTTGLTNSVTLDVDVKSRLHVGNAGVFSINFSAQLTNTSISDVTVTFWLRENGTDLPDTAKDITIPGNSLRYAADWGWLVDASVGDYYEIVYSTPDVSAFLDADGARVTPTRPALPSITVSMIQAGLGSTAEITSSFNLPLTTVLDNGTANSGIFLDQNILVYNVEGIGGAPNPGNKVSYFQFVVPSGYSNGGNLDIVLSTSMGITNFVITARINGNVIDATINGVDLNTVVTYPTFEKQTLTFGTALIPGDIVTLDIAFEGQNNMDYYLRGLDFNYNIQIL